jgi:RecA-family ATPase
MDLAISVATGTQWWGLPTIKGKVCYINFEIQRPFFAKRYEDICKKKGANPEPGMFKCWTLRGYSEGLEKMSANIIKQLLQEDYSLIIFDPIYKALGDRDENKAGDVASMLNELEAIAVKTGAAIAFGAHYSKGNQAAKDAMDRIGGSGVFARDPDAILTMTPHEADECFTVDCTLRNFPPQKPFVVKWEWPLFDRDETEDPEQIKQPKKTRQRSDTNGQFQRKYSLDDILDCLKETNNGRATGELQKLVYDETGMSRAQFFVLKKDLDKSPFITKKNRRYYHVNPTQQ